MQASSKAHGMCANVAVASVPSRCRGGSSSTSRGICVASIIAAVPASSRRSVRVFGSIWVRDTSVSVKVLTKVISLCYILSTE